MVKLLIGVTIGYMCRDRIHELLYKVEQKIKDVDPVGSS